MYDERNDDTFLVKAEKKEHHIAQWQSACLVCGKS